MTQPQKMGPSEALVETLVAHEGQVVHPQLRELLGLARLEQAVLET